MASDRFAGTLICAGAATAFIATALLGPSLLWLLSLPSFGLVFLFGVYVAAGRSEGRILAVATLWFATVGGLPFLWIFGLSSWFGGLASLVGYLGLLGTAVVIVGAALKLMESQRTPARPPPSGLLKRAALLLGAGSFAFLLAAAMYYPGLSSRGYAELLWSAVLIVVGLWLHLFAWITLFAATGTGFDGGIATPRLNRARTAWTASALGLILSVYLVPLFSRDSYISLIVLFPLVRVLPYHPAVFAPVVLCHAYIFSGYSRFLPNGQPRTTAWIGVLALAAAAAVGLVGLLAYYAQVPLSSEVYWWVFLPFPSGSTAIGYGLVFSGWRQGTPMEEVEAPDRTDAGPVAR